MPFLFALKNTKGNVLVVAGPYMGLDRHKFFCLLVTFLLFFSAVFVPQISIPGGESVMSFSGQIVPSTYIYVRGESSLLVEARLFPDIQRAGGKEASACNSLYTDVVLFFFSFFSKTSTSARKKNKQRLFSFSLTPIPTR